MNPRRHIETWSSILLIISILGCTTNQSASHNPRLGPTGLIVDSKLAQQVSILTSEIQEPLRFPYSLTNTSNEDKTVKLVRTSCGCVAVKVASRSSSRILPLGKGFMLAAGERSSLDISVRLSGKPIGLHTFPTELSVGQSTAEELFSLPIPSVRILPDISSDPPVLSHQFRWDEKDSVAKSITITARQRTRSYKDLPNPVIKPLPSHIVLQSIVKHEPTGSVESDEFQDTKWVATIQLKPPMSEEYTTAHTLTVAVQGHHALLLPSVIKISRGVAAHPAALTFSKSAGFLPGTRKMLITATDGRPFSIKRMTARLGSCNVNAPDSRTAVTHLIEVTPIAIHVTEDVLEITTDHPDTPSILIKLSRTD